MVKGLLGKKVGMSQIYTEDGVLVPSTLVEVGPCYVLQIKTEESDGYSAVQIGFLDKKKKNATKPEIGHVAKANTDPKRHIREVERDGDGELVIGQELTVDLFQEDALVNVTGTTKGKGFAGVIKRWGFSGGPMAHGSTFHRAPGSIGPGTSPGRVIKGRKMPGRLGNKRKFIKNLKIVKIDKENNLMIIKGSVPGPVGGCILINKSGA